MIKDTIVKVKLFGVNIQHYKSQGYDGVIGDTIEVSPLHLTKSSTVKIVRVCDTCGVEKLISRKKYSPVCQKCRAKEQALPDSEKSGYSKCLDCTLYVKNASRCKPCHSKHMVGENNPNFGNGDKLARDRNPNWKGGKPKCIDCNNTLSNHNCENKVHQRCSPCHIQFCTKDNHPLYIRENHYCECGEPKSKSSSKCWECYTKDVENLESEKRTGSAARWASAVKDASGNECELCGKNKNLHAHHLEVFMANPELRCEVSNGVCLCRDCHIDFHKTYGFGDNTTQQYLEYKELKNASN